MRSAKRVLIVSYMFPPAGGIAVQRALSFARYLPDCGYEVDVLTARNPSVPVMDPGLLAKIPSAVQVHRTFTPEVSFSARQKIWRILSRDQGQGSKAASPAGGQNVSWKRKLSGLARSVLSPDPEVVWVPSARLQASRLIREKGIGTVFMTAPPFSTFLVGTALKKQFPGIRLIADFRDEWLKFYLSTFDFHSTPSIRKRAALIEREVVNLSDLVLTVTPSIEKEMRGRYPDLPANRFACIPNGYDPASFAGFRPRPHEGGKIVVTHAGTVYKSSSPRAFLDALESLPDEMRQRFEVRFVGRISEDQKPLFESRKIDLKLYGFLPQSEALRLLEETDFLLLSLDDSNHVTGKLFEYLATGKPILTFTPDEGELVNIVRETGLGWHADPADPQACRTLLEKVHKAAEGGENPARPNPEAVRRYERPAQAAELARLIENLALKTSETGS